MNPTVTLVCKIINASERPYTSKTSGEQVIFRELSFTAGSGMYKLPYDSKFTPLPLVDKKVELTMELVTFGDSVKPTLRVLSAKEVK